MTTEQRIESLRAFAAEAGGGTRRSVWASDVRFLLAELDAARAKAEKWDNRDTYVREALLGGRNIDRACERCGGYGSIVYGNTSTWRGGIGGNALTAGVCDHCWGSGDADKPWPSWRELDATLRAREAKLRAVLRQCKCIGVRDYATCDQRREPVSRMCPRCAALAEGEDRLCASCQCRHPKDVMCPPHEMRYSAEDK